MQWIAFLVLLSLFPLSFWIAFNYEGLMVRYHIDKIIHFCAGALVAFILHLRFGYRAWKLVIAAVIIGGGWELFEYYGTLAFRWPITDFSRHHYALDTFLDQIAVGCGAMLIGMFSRSHQYRVSVG